MAIKISGFSDEISNNFEFQLKAVRTLGMNYISFRSAWKKNIGDFSMVEVKNEILPLLKKYSVKVSSLGSPLGKVFINDKEAIKENLEKCKRLLDICEILDTVYIRLFSFYIPKGDSHEKWSNAVIDRMSEMLELFKGRHVIAIHENEKDIYGDTADNCLFLFNSLRQENLKCAFDFANFVQVREDPERAYRILRNYIEYVHVKDAILGLNDNVVCGLGDGHIKIILEKLLKEDHYNGFLTLEPHLVLFDTLSSLELKSAKDVIKKNVAKNAYEGYSMQYHALLNILQEIKQS